MSTIVEITDHGEVIVLEGRASERLQAFFDSIEYNVNNLMVSSDGTTGGTGSAGAGNQYIALSLPDGTTYKVLHDGTV